MNSLCNQCEDSLALYHLLITLFYLVSKAAGGYQTVPGIYTPDQIESWKRIVSAVHAKGCFMVMQMWNLGRAATPEQIRGEGEDFISSSNVPMQEDGDAPRPLTEAELKEHVAAYATASKNFIEVCGGDGG